ncbi:MAG: LamG domain-containing protein [Candidatus Woesearchaeota archaeon]|nr:LamG domain-containing protein [Candidatus Woesearchaeota archaeon]
MNNKENTTSHIKYYLIVSLVFVAMLVSITFLQYTGFAIFLPNQIEFIGPFNLSDNVSIMLRVNNQEYSKQLILNDYNVTKITASLDDFYLNLTAGNYTIYAYLIDNDTIIANTTIELTIEEETNKITQPLENITQPPLPSQIIVVDEQNNVVQTAGSLINDCTDVIFSDQFIDQLKICKVTNGSLIYSEIKDVVQTQNISLTKIYALDLSNFSNTDLYATANNTMLFKCDWSFTNKSCLDSWKFLQNLTINQQYNINLTNETSAFAEGNLIALQENITNRSLIQLQAEINKPVTWIKQINLENETSNLTVDLPSYASNISLDKIENNTKQKIKDYDIVKPQKAFGAKDIDNISLNIKEKVKKLEVKYETPPPLVQEQIEGDKKIVTVYSDIHYTDILTYTNLPTESTPNKIRLYWLTDGTKVLVDNITYLDENNNSLIDKIQWVTPSLSNQTYEVSITILTVQSYPTVQGNWTVLFNTTGTADLIINISNGTTWSNSNELNDLKFLEVRCGNNKLNYNWINDSVIIYNYECNQTASEISKVLTEGKHTLQFTFGNDTEYAYNYAQESILIACRFNDNDTICNDNENATIFQSVSYDDNCLHDGCVRMGWQNPWSNLTYSAQNNMKRVNFTVRMWVKPLQNYSSINSAAQFRYWQTLAPNNTDGGNYLILDLKDFNVTCIQQRNSDSVAFGAAWGSKPLPQNRWTYIACVFNDSNMVLYVNGQLIMIGRVPDPLYFPGVSANDKFYLGTTYFTNNLSRTSNATIDDFEIFSIPLTSQEIADDYYSCIPPVFSNTTTKNQNWDINYTCLQVSDEIALGNGNITIKDSGALILRSYSNLSFYMLNMTPFNSTKTFALKLSPNSKLNVSKK